MSLMRTLGRLTGSIWGNGEFISGMMQGIEPNAVAAAANENGAFMGEVLEGLDPVVMTRLVVPGLTLAAEVTRQVASMLAAAGDEGQREASPSGIANLVAGRAPALPRRDDVILNLPTAQEYCDDEMKVHAAK